MYIIHTGIEQLAYVTMSETQQYGIKLSLTLLRCLEEFSAPLLFQVTGFKQLSLWANFLAFTVYKLKWTWSHLCVCAPIFAYVRNAQE